MAGWLAEREERWKNFREINAISRPNAGSFATSVTRIRVQADIAGENVAYYIFD